MRLLLALLFLGFFPAASFAQVIPSADLIEHAKDYDGKTVVYEGEVIGDIMNRGNFVWLNVNDGANAVGIWSAKQICQEVTSAGNHKNKGDRIKVTGLFRRSCPEHGGDLDIHAESIRMVSAGKPLQEAVDPEKVRTFFSLLGILCLILLLSRLKLNSKPS
jgi:hypothetical protein